LCETFRSGSITQAHLTIQGAPASSQPPALQSQQDQPRVPVEVFPTPRGQVNMILMTGVSKRELKKLRGR
jgi:hypothetical protein